MSLSLKPKRPTAKKKTPHRRPASRPLVIDFHAHIVVPEIAAFADPYRSRAASTERLNNPRLTRRDFALAKKWGDRARRRMVDFKARLREMDKTGIDIQVLTPSNIVQYTNWADPKTSLKMERLSNDRQAEIVAKVPDRFIGIGSVPLQSPKLAVQELERCITELGFKGVQIASTAGNMELGDPRLRPFWAKVEALGAVVFLHPSGVEQTRYQRHQLWNSIGQPLEEAMAMMSLIYEGVLDEFPKLKICVAHGGGYLPYYAGRVDRNYFDKPFLRLGMKRPPSEYMKRSFFYDTCLYNREMLDALVRKVGARRIVLGSDYPVGEEDPVGFVRRCRLLSSEDKARILSGNATKLLGLRI